MIKKYMWMGLGFLSLGMAYIGFVVPGIPFSIFLVFSAYCFAKSNKRMHDWLYNHKYFGPFLTNWVEKKVFPTWAKIYDGISYVINFSIPVVDYRKYKSISMEWQLYGTCCNLGLEISWFCRRTRT